MGKKDEICFEFRRNRPECYAELFNRLVFGRDLISWRELKELNVKQGFPEGRREYWRDNLRKSVLCMQDGRRTYAFAGIEDSTYVDYGAPVKGMLYDALTLREQFIRNEALRGDAFLSSFPKGGILKPVITVFFDWTGKNWDGPLHLFDMFDPQERNLLAPFLNDYQVHVISPGKLEESRILTLDTELREIMAFQKYRNVMDQLKRIIRSERYRFDSLTELSAELITTVTNTKVNLANLKREGETTVNMCLAIDQMCEEARQEGRMEVLEEVRKANAGRKEAESRQKEAEARQKKAEAESREFRRKYNELRAQLEMLKGNRISM